MAKARKDNRGRALHKGETYRKSDNTYMYVYKDPLGRRKYIYSQDLAKLREREKLLLRDQLDGLDVYAAARATINYTFDRYISMKRDIKETTRAGYHYYYDHYVRPGFGQKKIADVKYSDVLKFYIGLMDEKHLKVSTIESIQNCVRPTFELAYKDDIIRKNPCTGIISELKKSINDKTGVRRALSVDEQTAFTKYLSSDEDSRKWYPLFTVMLGTGMRIGEVLGLRWEDIDFDNRRISVNHSLVYYKDVKDSNKFKHAISTPKTEAGIRYIPMIDTVYDAFKEQKEMWDIVGGCRSEIDGMKNFIFFNRFCDIQSRESVNKAIVSISERYNAKELLAACRENREPVLLPHFTCHHLRHTFCTRLCEADINIKVIQQIMGHKDIQTTLDIYAEVSETKKHKSMLEFAEMFKNIL